MFAYQRAQNMVLTSCSNVTNNGGLVPHGPVCSSSGLEMIHVSVPHSFYDYGNTLEMLDHIPKGCNVVCIQHHGATPSWPLS